MLKNDFWSRHFANFIARFVMRIFIPKFWILVSFFNFYEASHLISKNLILPMPMISNKKNRTHASQLLIVLFKFDFEASKIEKKNVILQIWKCESCFFSTQTVLLDGVSFRFFLAFLSFSICIAAYFRTIHNMG